MIQMWWWFFSLVVHTWARIFFFEWHRRLRIKKKHKSDLGEICNGEKISPRPLRDWFVMSQRDLGRDNRDLAEIKEISNSNRSRTYMNFWLLFQMLTRVYSYFFFFRARPVHGLKNSHQSKTFYKIFSFFTLKRPLAGHGAAASTSW